MDDATAGRVAAGAAAAVTLALGLTTVAVRRAAPAETGPHTTAVAIVTATRSGDCDAVLALMTEEARDEQPDGCAAFGAGDIARLLAVETRDRAGNSAVVVLTVGFDDTDSTTTTAELFERRDGRWLWTGEQAACADPPGAGAAVCRRFDVPAG